MTMTIEDVVVSGIMGLWGGMSAMLVPEYAPVTPVEMAVVLTAVGSVALLCLGAYERGRRQGAAA